MKIVSTGKVLNSPQFYKKKRRKKFIYLSLFFIVFVAAISSLIYFSRQEQFLISEVAILGENIVDKDDMTQAVRDLLDGYYLGLVPRTNFLVYPRRAVRQSLMGRFPRLKSVDLDLSEIRILRINIEERLPAALYCLDASGQANTSDCYFLDEDGFIFASAPSFSGDVYFVYATEASIEEPIGKRFVSVEEFESIKAFIKDFSSLGIRALALEITDREYHLFLPNGAVLIWLRESDSATVLSNLGAFLSDENISAQIDFFEKILYLDLRSENKVFYKFREQI